MSKAICGDRRTNTVAAALNVPRTRIERTIEEERDVWITVRWMTRRPCSARWAMIS
jgi:hypothetical protein